MDNLAKFIVSVFFEVLGEMVKCVLKRGVFNRLQNHPIRHPRVRPTAVRFKLFQLKKKFNDYYNLAVKITVGYRVHK